MSSSEPLLITQDGGVLTLSINDPPINRMTMDCMDAVETAVQKAAKDPGIRALVFTAEGEDNFSVGMDLKQLYAAWGDTNRIESMLDQRLRILDAIENLNKPSIATLFGYCLGGGLELPLACHFRFAATEGSKIGLPEMDIGGIPAWGGTARLTRYVGQDRALDMILRARKVDGPEALAMGLVQEVHPLKDLKAAAHELAKSLAAMPPVAVSGVLRCVVGADGAPLEVALAEERKAYRLCAESHDHFEGLRAFVEKRAPIFT